MAVDFATSVAAWCDQAKGRSEAVFRAIAADALARVKELTPVRSGNLRANWQASFDDSAMPVDRQDPTKSPGLSVASTAAGEAAGFAARRMGAGGIAAVGIGAAASAATLVVGSGFDARPSEVAGNVAGSVAGGLVGSAVGSTFGPVGTAVGSAVGSAIGSSAGSAVAKMASSDGNPLEKAKIGQVIYLLNPVSYARAVEYGRHGTRKDGSTYEVPGKGMMQQTIAELPQIAQAAADRIARS